MNDAIDRTLQEAVESGDVPALAAIVVDKGGVVYEGQAGPGRIADAERFGPDTVYQIHSMTKPIAAAGCMQLVEAGKLDLDADCGALVPALADPEVLEGFDGAGRPKLRPAEGEITLRRLLTHTSGFVYDLWNADQLAYLKQRGLARDDLFDDPRNRPPLAFDPGARWEYGVGIDWAGKTLEAVAGECLDSYLRANLLEPLGMTSTGFVPTDDIRARTAAVHVRGQDGEIARAQFDYPDAPRERYTGGGGMYGTARDYGRFMRMVLNEGELNGVRVLKPETVAEMRRNSIGDIQVTGLATAMPRLTCPFDFYPGMEKRWGLSFMINMEDVPSARRAGSLAWAGLRNTYFWIDPDRGLAGAIFAQMFPFADPKVLAAYDGFERAVYAAAG